MPNLSLNYSYWGMQSIVMLITALLIPKFQVSNPLSALLLVAGLGFANTHIWDAALFLKIPDSISSETIVLMCSNAVLFWTLVKLLPGVEIKGIIAPIIAPIIFTFMGLFLHKYDDKINWVEIYKQTKIYVTSVKDYVSSEKNETLKTK